MDAGPGTDPAEWLRAGGWSVETGGGDAWMAGAGWVFPPIPPRLRSVVEGVPVTVSWHPLRLYREPDATETHDFLRLFEETFARLRPSVVVAYGGDRLTCEILARSRRRGVSTVFTIHNFQYHNRTTFADVDAIIVPSRFAADHYRDSLGLHCSVIPNVVDLERVRVESPAPRYATLINPSLEKGVFPFVRIADELGRRRPDIPLLVVESRGTEEILVSCGIDLRPHGNVHLMGQTPDPRRFWRVTRICLMPSLFRESQGLVAVEAMANGIPVIGSDRGALPETLGRAGIVLPLPERLTPTTRILPTAEEVGPWVEAVIGLWDDSQLYEEYYRRAMREFQRWEPDALESQHARFFSGLRATRKPEQPQFE